MRGAGERTGKQLDWGWGASLAVTVLPVVRGGPPLLLVRPSSCSPTLPLGPSATVQLVPTATVASPGTAFGSSGSRVGSFFVLATTHGMQDLPRPGTEPVFPRTGCAPQHWEHGVLNYWTTWEVQNGLDV